MKIIRVFPSSLKKRGSNMLPRDRYAFVGDPPMIRPDADEVHISCAFSWDKKEAERLALAWGQYYDNVQVGGPAFGWNGDEFTPGKYIMPGVTFTSYGCNNKCPWCLVRNREGVLTEMVNFSPGYIIQDNNWLQCSRQHIESVFEMLRYQGRPVLLSGGLESHLVTDWFVDELKTVPVYQIFLACDTKEAITSLRKACLMIGLPRDKVRCYVLLKFDPGETINTATARMVDIWEAGAMPFAQLYQPEDKWIEYSREWREFARRWSRPAIMKEMTA